MGRVADGAIEPLSNHCEKLHASVVGRQAAVERPAWAQGAATLLPGLIDADFTDEGQPNWASAPRAVVTTTVRPMTTCSAPSTGTGGGGRYASAM